ncbi:MAG: branched-chain-amino-acid transaminase [Verrucomicrobiales bacterium]
MKIYIDGEMLDEADAKISVFDHGLLYGDGVFEGIRMYNGRVFRLEEHIDRLYDSARVIMLEIGIDKRAMTDAVLETVRANNLNEGYVRLVVTRGVGSLGLNPFQCPKASVIVIAANITLYAPEKYQNGLKVVTCSTRRPTPASLSPAVKSLNYLNNVMAKGEAIHADADEGLMLNEQGYVAECTGDNLFIIRDGRITTPPVSSGSLPGITWQVIFDIAAEKGVPIEEKQMTRYEIYTADEAFLTGTAAEVIPMVSLDQRPIGDGKPGEMTGAFIARFREIASSTGAEI